MTHALWGILVLFNIIPGIVLGQFVIEGTNFTDVPMVKLSTTDNKQSPTSPKTTQMPTKDMTTEKPGPPIISTKATTSESTKKTKMTKRPVATTHPPGPPPPLHQTCGLKTVKTVIKTRWFMSDKEVEVPTCSGHCLTGAVITQNPFGYEARANCCMPDEKTVSEKRIELLNNATKTRANFTMKSFTKCKCSFLGDEDLDEYTPKRVKKLSKWDLEMMWWKMLNMYKRRGRYGRRGEWRKRDGMRRMMEEMVEEQDDEEIESLNERREEMDEEREPHYEEERDTGRRGRRSRKMGRRHGGMGRRYGGMERRHGGMERRHGRRGRGRRY